MAFNGFKLFSCLILLLILFSTTQAKRDVPKYSKKTPFEFMNNLKGYNKGTNSKDIHHLKNFLHKFGYLHLNPSDSNDDAFDDALEAAIKTYQTNFHINPTGVIDEETIATMIMPRCGVADIVNGTNFMRAKNKKESSPTTFHIVAHYAFFPGGPRWPNGVSHLTYGFLPNVPSRVYGPVVRAFGRWAAATFFTFSQAQNYQDADLVIGFYSGDHGDGAPFDGPLGILAHSFAPTDGRFHYDADETWSVQPDPNAFHLETVATHEIGHLLGLGHSSVRAAIMWPSTSPGETKGLNADDIEGIRALYNV